MAKFLDPQRQYAQLLTLWAQGNKIIRRQTNGQLDSTTLATWQLAQSIASHGVAVLPVSLDPAIVLISPDQEGQVWGVLVDKGWGQNNARFFRHMLWLDRHSAPALSVGPLAWSLSRELAVGLGIRQWLTLCRWSEKRCDAVDFGTKSEATTVLAALAHQPLRMGKAPSQEWLGLSRLWRHQGTWQSVSILDPKRYPWLVCDLPSNKYLWPRDAG